ncbi:MAG: hypothetical protein QOF26_483, partial [Baekduia sp.]|nr:hypothetical protein [Baekduia sp.]
GLYDTLQTPIAAAGTAGTAVPIVTGWASVEGPSLVGQGTSLSAFFSGTQTTTTGDPHEGLDLATSADGGATWALAPTAVAASDFASSRDASVVATSAGFVQSWYAGSETVVHAGLDPATPNQRGYGLGTNQMLASSPGAAAGDVLAAWCTGVQGANGVFVQPVSAATGAPAGPARLMPGSTAVVGGVPETFCTANSRVALTARAQGGYFVAATDVHRTAVKGWRVDGAPAVTLAGGASTKQHIAAAGTPAPGRAAGSVWVGWFDDGDLKLRRSNRTATVFGATVTLPAPKVDGVYGLDLAAQGDRVDAIIRVEGAGTVSLQHAQAFPGLTLAVVRGGRRAAFRVLDAGDPVKDATVTVAGHSATTDTAGRASIAIGRHGRFAATATKAKYVAASTTVRVR